MRTRKSLSLSTAGNPRCSYDAKTVIKSVLGAYIVIKWAGVLIRRRKFATFTTCRQENDNFLERCACASHSRADVRRRLKCMKASRILYPLQNEKYFIC